MADYSRTVVGRDRLVDNRQPFHKTGIADPGFGTKESGLILYFSAATVMERVSPWKTESQKNPLHYCRGTETRRRQISWVLHRLIPLSPPLRSRLVSSTSTSARC